MNQICVRLPRLDARHTIDVELTVDGTTRFMNYRVESLDWTDGTRTHAERIDRLRRFIHDYDAGWELVHIGRPDGTVVPITFRQRVVRTR